MKYYLDLYSQVEAKKAVPRDDQNILNRGYSSIHGSPGPARTKKIFVGGLASTVTETDFKKYFNQFGTITDVVVMYDHNTQRPRGFGFITYESEEAVDKVLLKTFHELNGKMVEVKRAVPKESSPGPSRNQVGGYNFGLNRVSSFLNGYIQGFNQSSVGGYGVRTDGRFSPATVARGGFPPFSPSGFGMGLNMEPGLSPSYGGSTNLSPNLSYRQGLNPLYSGNANRYGNPVGYGGGNGGSGSILSSTNRNLWGNEGLNFATNSSNSNAYVGSGIGNSGVGNFGNIGPIWGSSPMSGLGGGIGSTYSSGNLNYSTNDVNFGSGVVGFARNNGNNVAPGSPFAASDGGYDVLYGDFHEGGLDPTWQSSPSELEGSGSFGYGIASSVSDVTTKTSASYVGGYGVTSRQSNRGKMFFLFLLIFRLQFKILNAVEINLCR